MWPLLVTAIVAIAVIIERLIWWKMAYEKRDLQNLDKIYVAIEAGDVKVASGLARNSEDARLRVIWHGLNHYYSSLQGALQVAAGVEIKQAGKFIAVLDTIVTLAPLLGLLGTVTGLMRAFFNLGTAELSVDAITGGIAEALIATACGLTIAVVSLIALNFFSSRLAEFEYELETACTNTEVLMASYKSRAQAQAPVQYAA